MGFYFLQINIFSFSSASSTDDRSTLSDDDEGISSDDLDNEDISRKAIYRALMVNRSSESFARILKVLLFFFYRNVLNILHPIR
jgi:hypothetical protein